MNIYAGNLSLEVTEDELRCLFIAFGNVKSVTLMNDVGIGSGQGRGCAYVEMASAREGESAIEQLQGKSIKGCQVVIIQALPMTRDPNDLPGSSLKASGFSRKARYWGGKWRKT